MKQSTFIVNICNLYSATCHSKSIGDKHLEEAERYKSDSDKNGRLKKQECRTCYYLMAGKIGGSAITERHCGICGQLMTFANSCTDVLCLECAKKHELCKHCGSDIKLRVRRTTWPETEIKLSTECTYE